jgi:hypothetical protein
MKIITCVDFKMKHYLGVQRCLICKMQFEKNVQNYCFHSPNVTLEDINDKMIHVFVLCML